MNIPIKNITTRPVSNIGRSVNIESSVPIIFIVCASDAVMLRSMTDIRGITFFIAVGVVYYYKNVSCRVWAGQDLNLRPSPCKGDVIATKLPAHIER